MKQLNPANILDNLLPKPKGKPPGIIGRESKP
jgi:hypothetical protein